MILHINLNPRRLDVFLIHVLRSPEEVLTPVQCSRTTDIIQLFGIFLLSKDSDVYNGIHCVANVFSYFSRHETSCLFQIKMNLVVTFGDFNCLLNVRAILLDFDTGVIALLGLRHFNFIIRISRH